MNKLQYAIQDLDQLPKRIDWLTPAERERYEGFRFDKRQKDWLLGRWAAKQALLTLSGLPQSDIARFEVLAASNGAPEAKLDGKPCDTGLSISHSNGRAFSVVSTDTCRLGCDLELVEPRSEDFVDTFFTATERERVQQAAPEYRDTLTTMIWSTKESTLKALRTGLRADTRSVEVIDGGDYAGEGWRVARAVVADADEFNALWRVDDGFVLSIATREAMRTPIAAG